MEKAQGRCPGCRRESCDGCGLFKDRAAAVSGRKAGFEKINTNKQIKVEFPGGFAAEPEEGFGISFDVGTTTLGGMLWDLEEGVLLDAAAGANPQAVWGADIISRIRAAGDERVLKTMQGLLIKRLDEMARSMACGTAEKRREAGNDGKKERGDIPVRKAVIVGNTAMCEILLGMEPAGLVRAPFTPDYQSTFRIRGGEAGFCFLKDTEMIVLPPIGGYVGADALAVDGYVAFQEKERRVLAVDIGTNGEILLRCGGRRYACSAAAGPALEGGAVSQGMRAVNGAIDMVSLGGRFPMQDIMCRVSGAGTPAGICGSGLVDALAALFRTGVLDESGYMRNAREAKAAGVPERICRRIKTEQGRQKFLLTDASSPVYLTAEDVRQLQLAISAMRSGMEILLRKAGQSIKELDRIYLAGAFGCYINAESAMEAGLLPKVPKEKLVQAGNLAGVGAAMALLSPKALRFMEEESRGFAHVELAQEDAFEEAFLTNLNFCQEKNTTRE